MKTSYIPKGVCSRVIEVELEDGVIREVNFKGGCDGNLQGITRLVKNRQAHAVVEQLRGIKCAGKGTSCPDQLAIALERALEAERLAPRP